MTSDAELRKVFLDYLRERVGARRRRVWEHASKTLVTEIQRAGEVLGDLTGCRVGWTLNRGASGVAQWPVQYTLAIWSYEQSAVLRGPGGPGGPGGQVPAILLPEPWADKASSGGSVRRQHGVLDMFFLTADDCFPILVGLNAAQAKGVPQAYLPSVEALRGRISTYFYDPSSQIMELVDRHCVDDAVTKGETW